MSRDSDVVVVGGGVTAIAMATLLLARRLAAPGRVVVLDERPVTPAPEATDDWELRVFALSRASQRLLVLCGAWQRLPADKVFAYDRMCVWDGGSPAPAADGRGGGEGALWFDSAELGEADLGSIVEGRALLACSRAAAEAAGVVFIESTSSRLTFDSAGVRVALRDGRELRAQLLIAADGADSPTRRRLGIDTAGHAYHQDALVAHVRTARPHRRTAWQRFLPTGPLALLPLPDGRSSIVWSATRAEALRLRRLDAAAFGAALTAASDAVLGRCELTTPVASFPLHLQYALEYVRPRAVLIGDAAHAVHPLAGQGLNLGLLDCATLADAMSGAEVARLGEPQILRRYERRRRSENMLAAAALDGLERLFGNTDAALGRLRVAGLDAVARMPFLRRRFAEHALGLRGDLPAFLKAEVR